MLIWSSNLSLVLIAAALLAVLATVAGQYARHSFYPWLKPLPLLLLMLAVWLAPGVTAKTVFLLALLAGWLGDVALLFRRGFLPGLLAFLLGHLALLLALLQWGATLTPLVVGLAVLVALAMTAWLRPPGKLLTLAVSIYCAVLALVVLTAVPFAYSQSHWWWLAPAALLFMLSDGLLGWNKFRHPLPAAQLWILASYFSAQWLFVYAYLTVSP